MTQELTPNTPITQENVGLLKAGDWLKAVTDETEIAAFHSLDANGLWAWLTNGLPYPFAALTYIAPDTGDVAALRDWQPMRTAPKDGTEIETLCVHPTAHYSTDAFGEGWAAVVKAKWIDHNDGGWTWHGLCGVHMAWRPLAALSKPNAPGREG